MVKSKKPSKKRDPFDYYPTPEWCVHRLLEADILPNKKEIWLEPSAGDGAVIRAVSSFAKTQGDSVVRYNPYWVAYEIQPRFKVGLESLVDSSKVHIENFLDIGDRLALGVTPKVIIGNPPYSCALEFVKKSMDLDADYIAFLLRISFLGSNERSSFMREHMPGIYILPNRPSFDGNGSDTSEYAWFVWKKNIQGTYEASQGVSQILANTPKETRKPKTTRTQG